MKKREIKKGDSLTFTVSMYLLLGGVFMFFLTAVYHTSLSFYDGTAAAIFDMIGIILRDLWAMPGEGKWIFVASQMVIIPLFVLIFTES